MNGIVQGVGSSPTGPTIRKTDRRRLRLLDRKISRFDYVIWNSVWGSDVAIKHQTARRKADQQRKQLREWMKGYGE